MNARLLICSVGFGLALTASASAFERLQPGMLTMMQQGGVEHGVPPSCILPGYNPRYTCHGYGRPSSSLALEEGHEAVHGFERRIIR